MFDIAVILLFTKTVVFVAKRRETHGIRSCCAHDVVCHSGFLHNDGVSLHRHCQRSLRTVGRLWQLRYGEDGAFSRNFRQLPSAVGADDFLLFSHCLLTTYQGNNSTSSRSFSDL